MVELGHNVICMCPINKLIQNYEAATDKLTSATINDFFNMKIGDMKIQSCECSDYNDFVFDEIYCNDMHILSSIKTIDNKNNKLLIATGDSEHLKPVNKITNQDIDYDDYMDSVMSQLFEYDIFAFTQK